MGATNLISSSIYMKLLSSLCCFFKFQLHLWTIGFDSIISLDSSKLTLQGMLNGPIGLTML
jgi:hypothetical protein